MDTNSTAQHVEEKNTVKQEFPIIKTWDDIPNLDPNILRGIFSYGFENPSSIQQQAIVPLMQKYDVIAQAQSGTGKTAAFVIGALSAVDVNEKHTQVIILSPTKELTTQTANVVRKIGCMMPELTVDVMYGGIQQLQSKEHTGIQLETKEKYNKGIQQLQSKEHKGIQQLDTKEKYNKGIKETPHILCGCPGKIHDMMARGIIDAQKIRFIILDEADELLSSKGYNNNNNDNKNNYREREREQQSHGFKEQIHTIFQQLNESVQVALFTATVPAYMETLLSKIMRDPVHIQIEPTKLTLEGIKQYYVQVFNDFDKLALLKTIYNTASVSQSIIYCNSVKRVMDLYNTLYKEGFPICCIHSNMDKHIRDTSFRDFITGKYRILVSSDVTARGIDVQQVSLVINYDIPSSKYTYLHRIGRSGRWGRKGVAINFVAQRDASNMSEIEKYYDCNIEELPQNFSM